MKLRSHIIMFFIGLMAQQILAQMQPLSHQGGFYSSPSKVCLSFSQRTWIKEKLQQNITVFEEQGIINPVSSRDNVLFQWPLKADDNYEHNDYHAISNFVDHDADFPQKVADYNCGERSYDTNEGHNHSGTDFFLWPFGWNLMASNQIRVVAAAPGIIIEKLDGEPDRSCDLSAIAVWNAIFVQHEDGSQAWYGHLKKNSLKTKMIGESVEVGEFLGFVGSSGISSGPHLHLEIYNDEGNIVDPFQGECNNNDSWWLEQRPYYDSGLNRISTHAASPNLSECPEEETIHAENEFCAEDTVFFAVFLRDQLAGQILQYEVRQPDNTLVSSWRSTLQNAPHYSASYWYFPVILPTDAMEGDWVYKVTYLDKIYTHTFNVCDPLSIQQISANFPPHSISPNPIQDHFQVLIDIYVNGVFKLEIRDVTGRLIKARSEEFLIGQHQIDFSLSNLPIGLYLLSVWDEQNAVVAQKIIKQ